MQRRIFGILNSLARHSVKSEPALWNALENYRRRSQSTGAKFTTVWALYNAIRIQRPRCILECGTGLTTIVILEAIRKVREHNPSYKPDFVSMESVREWYDHAVEILPPQYRDDVELVFGERKLFQINMFRGYVYSNRPGKPFDFVFIDGPGPNDEFGGSFSADATEIAETRKSEISGLVDTRVKTLFVMQQLFGVESVRYSPYTRVGHFRVRATESIRQKYPSEAFRIGMGGRITIR